VGLLDGSAADPSAVAPVPPGVGLISFVPSEVSSHIFRVGFNQGAAARPVAEVLGIYAAVTRRTLDGKSPGGWVPDEKVSVEEALRAYTTDAAFAEFAESDKGSIEEGKLADLVALDRDIFKMPAAGIMEARVRLTVFDGKVIHRKDR